MVRDLFVAERGKVLVSLDYSQLELRVAAMLSQDPVMLAIYESGVDFHQKTAEMISMVAWGIPPEQVEKKHRSLAKTVNFGILYGKTAVTFAKEFGISHKAAQAIIDAIMGRFSKLAAWKENSLREARFSGEVWTHWDGRPARRRPLWGIGSALDGERITAENGSGNTPIQGTASDYCVASLCGIVDWVLDSGVPAKVILPVHDSIMLEVAEPAVSEVVDYCRTVMEGWPSQGVKLVADVEIGPSWGSLEKVKA
jgi:DNA polymerase-1